MKGNLAPVPPPGDPSGNEPERPNLSVAPEESPLIRTYAAFLLALEEERSVALDDALSTHLDAVGEAIGFF